MSASVRSLIEAYDSRAPLAHARTPPSGWYTDSRIDALEAESVFAMNWQLVARVDQLENDGEFVSADVAGEPIVIVRHGKLRAFYNVCRHHAARVVPHGDGCVNALHCPYHGWTYNLDGTLRSAPHFEGVDDFDEHQFGLNAIRVDMWECWVFVCLDPDAPSLEDFLGSLFNRLVVLDVSSLKFHKRISYDMNCNWKVFVDNYHDGGYHVPHIHRGLTSALDTQQYKIEIDDRYCLQTCPIDSGKSDVRAGELAFYCWLYPNTMINWYDGVMDVNLTVPLPGNRCRVHFDHYFADQDDAFKQQSIAVADQIQLEDIAISESVQIGLQSRSYDTGRLSVAKESGEHLFHRLLHGDLQKALGNL